MSFYISLEIKQKFFCGFKFYMLVLFCFWVNIVKARKMGTSLSVLLKCTWQWTVIKSSSTSWTGISLIFDMGKACYLLQQNSLSGANIGIVCTGRLCNVKCLLYHYYPPGPSQLPQCWHNCMSVFVTLHDIPLLHNTKLIIKNTWPSKLGQND